jgi:asparagine synthase (glutamine-hydrolysing)
MAPTAARRAARELIRLLRSEFSRTEYRDKHLAVSFSGGLDSTLLARLATERATVSGIVAGSRNSIDVENARSSADAIGIGLREIEIDEALAIEGARCVSEVTGSVDPLTISFELPLFFVLRSATEDSVITGQGADELFGGYSRYKGLSEIDFKTVRAKDIGRVLGPISEMELRMATSQKKTVLKPFTCGEVVSYAMGLPYSLVRPAEERKVVVREALRELNLHEVAKVEKKAAQYGSGVSQLLKRAARRKGMSLGEFVANLSVEG